MNRGYFLSHRLQLALLLLAIAILFALAWSCSSWHSKNTEIHVAAMQGDLERIKALLKNNRNCI